MSQYQLSFGVHYATDVVDWAYLVLSKEDFFKSFSSSFISCYASVYFCLFDVHLNAPILPYVNPAVTMRHVLCNDVRC